MLRGGLFTRYFLEDGIRDTEAYKALAPLDVACFADATRAQWAKLEAMPRPSEAETEHELIFPVLDLLGWQHYPQQEPGRGRRDIADALLFLNGDAKERARRLPSADRFRHGVVVVENEARDTALDRASGRNEAPSSQLLRYLGRAEVQSDGAVRWGLLTSGRFWRLYSAQARARAEGFVEFDLAGIIGLMPPPAPAGAPADHWLRVFLLLFRRQALQPRAPDGHTFLDEALAEGRRYEERVTEALSQAVFDRVFPQLVNAFARHDPQARVSDAAWRGEAREAAGCCSYSTPRIATCCQCAILDMRHTACAGCVRMPRSPPISAELYPARSPHGGRDCGICSRQSLRETPVWACRPTTVDCSRTRAATCCCAPISRTPLLPRFSTQCHARALRARVVGSTTAICRFSTSARSTSGCWSSSWSQMAGEVSHSGRIRSRARPLEATTRRTSWCSSPAANDWPLVAGAARCVYRQGRGAGA